MGLQEFRLGDTRHPAAASPGQKVELKSSPTDEQSREGKECGDRWASKDFRAESACQMATRQLLGEQTTCSEFAPDTSDTTAELR